MSDIKVIITGDVSGLETATKKAQVELGKTGIAAQKMGTGISSAGGLAQKAAGQIGSMVGSLASGGLITAITLAGVALFELGKNLFDVTEEQKNLNEALEGGKSAYVKATIEVYNLRTAFQQAENGIIDKEKALKLYNSTLGKTLGQTKDFDEAEKSFIANAANYIKFTLLKAAANVALGKAAEQAFEIERNKQLGATKEGFFSFGNLASIFGGQGGQSDELRALLRMAEAKKSQVDFQKIYNSLMAQANSLGFQSVENEDKQTDAIVKKTAAQKKYNETLLDPRSGLLPQPSEAAGGQPSFKLTPKVIVQPKIEFIKDPENEKRVFEGLKDMMPDAVALQKFQGEATAAISQTVSNIVQDSISTAADSIGEALAGGKDVIPRLFDGIIKGIGSQVKELGKYLVKIGLEMLSAKKAVKALGLTPQTAIIAGIGLEVLGALLMASANKKANSVGFASGTTGVQQGGFYNVGERGPERIYLPTGARVQPNNEVQAFGGGGITLLPSMFYEGTGFRIMLNRVDDSMSRRG